MTPQPDPIPDPAGSTATIATDIKAVPSSQPIVPLHVQHRRWSPVALLLWVFVILAGILLEGVGLLRADDAWPPLTHVVVAFVPEGMTMAFIVWLSSHFTSAYIFDRRVPEDIVFLKPDRTWLPPNADTNPFRVDILQDPDFGDR